MNSPVAVISHHNICDFKNKKLDLQSSTFKTHSIMKKIMFFMLSVLLMTACGGPKNEKDEARRILKNEAEIADNTLKEVQIDFATTCNGCEFSNDIFHYYYTINEEYITIESLKVCEDELKENIRKELERLPETQELIKHIKTIDGKMKYQYTGSQSHEQFTITLEF